MTTDSRQMVSLGAGADRASIRMEYEATGADARILLLLDNLDQAERVISEQVRRIRELETRLTRSPAYTPGEVFLNK